MSTFSDQERAEFARDVDHILRVVDQTNTLTLLDGVDRMVRGLMAKYTKFYGLLKHKRATIVNDDGLVHLQQRIVARREQIQMGDPDFCS